MPVRMSDLTGCDGSMSTISSSGPIAAKDSSHLRIARHAQRITWLIPLIPFSRTCHREGDTRAKTAGSVLLG